MVIDSMILVLGTYYKSRTVHEYFTFLNDCDLQKLHVWKLINGMVFLLLSHQTMKIFTHRVRILRWLAKVYTHVILWLYGTYKHMVVDPLTNVTIEYHAFRITQKLCGT